MWHIGQDIVCIRDHSRKTVKNGEVYTVNGIRKGCCSIEIDVGIRGDGFYCCPCGTREKTDIWWFSEILFKPLDELSDISELLEVLNKENYQEV